MPQTGTPECNAGGNRTIRSRLQYNWLAYGYQITTRSSGAMYMESPGTTPNAL